MTQKTRELSRLTIASSLEEKKLDMKTAAMNAYLQEEDRKHRETIQNQQRIDYLFDKINRDNCKFPKTQRLLSSIRVDYYEDLTGSTCAG